MCGIRVCAYWEPGHVKVNTRMRVLGAVACSVVRIGHEGLQNKYAHVRIGSEPVKKVKIRLLIAGAGSRRQYLSLTHELTVDLTGISTMTT